MLIVSGIWPPDVGGPASHAPEVAEFLLGRGHEVEVVTTADAPPEQRAYPVRAVPRRTRQGERQYRVAALIHHRARECDVVYATSMLNRTAIGCALARKPFVAKLTTDPAFERARRLLGYSGTLDEFQRVRSPLQLVRNLMLRRAARVVCPSEYLAGLARGWGVSAQVLPNPVEVPDLPSREELRARHGFEGPTLVFSGRLVPQKDLGTLLAAAERVPEATLLVAGDGAERALLDGRARALGALPRGQVLELLRAADLAVLSSRWENFPHALVEALAVGTPVVATAVGGVPEIVRDGENGLLVPPRDPEALAGAIRRGLAERERLAVATVASVARFAPARIYGELERILEQAAST
ncbi:MAG TPA: glycosyltransferase family 4 protein [Gaiellaceae bacterium]|nr:glycosyltransferase family 4 protein [Gaiellaceae bacterium]